MDTQGGHSSGEGDIERPSTEVQGRRPDPERVPQRGAPATQGPPAPHLPGLPQARSGGAIKTNGSCQETFGAWKFYLCSDGRTTLCIYGKSFHCHLMWYESMNFMVCK